jgi:uncharacterized C2H2 Zn-finger protein
LIKHITKVHEKSEEKHMPTPSSQQGYNKGYNTSGYYINSTSPNASPKICCGTCGEIFQSEDILNEHITKVHPTLVSRKSSLPKADAPKTQCEKCDTQFVSEDFLKKHISKSHSKYSHGKASPTNPTPPAFTKTMKQTCEKCDTTFVNEDFLIKHIAKNHANEDMVYKNGQIAPFNRDLAVDAKSVQKSKSVDTPEIAPAMQSNLPMPTPGITKSTSPKAESKICCGKCGFTFQSEDILNKHIAIYHEKFVEKPTNLVSTPTPAAGALKKPTPPKPGTKICCGKCDETFSTVYFLNKHYAMYHADKSVEKSNRVTSPTPVTPTPMPTPTRSSPRKATPKICCAKCGSFFNDIDSLSKHIASVHVQFVEKPSKRVSSPAPILPTPTGAPTKSNTLCLGQCQALHLHSTRPARIQKVHAPIHALATQQFPTTE